MFNDIFIDGKSASALAHWNDIKLSDHDNFILIECYVMNVYSAYVVIIMIIFIDKNK